MTDDLDRVLHGLGTVDVPQGLEGRVLRAMAAREPARRMVWGWAAVMALVLLGSFVGWRNLRLAGLADTQTFHEAEKIGHAEVTAESRVDAHETHRRSQLRPRTITAPLPVAVIMGHPDVTVDPGFPAPVAPLTEQERLLLRLARRANGATLAMFDPALREERAAAEKAEFEFFNPQPAVVTAEPEETDHAVQSKQ